MSRLEEDDFVLEDEEDIHLRPPHTDFNSAMVASPTTDTLDSVALEPSPSDDVSKDEVSEEPLLSSTKFDLDHSDDAENTDETTVKEQTSPFLDNAGEQKVIGGNDQAATNISSYFSNSGEDIFDSLGGAVDDDKLGSDMFMSIAISKSEEDIRASEMNAREITALDVSGSLSPEDPGIPHQDSFYRRPEGYQDMLGDDDKGGNETEEMKEESSEAEDELKIGVKGDSKENLTHIPHREHKSSTCEPETIAFEGEGDILGKDQEELDKITGLAEKEDFEDFTAQNDDLSTKSGYLTQVSRTSDHSESSVSGITAPNSQHQISGKINPPVDSGTRLQGPVLGSTPSQLSPMGTPVHQAAGSQDQPASAPPLQPMNPPVLNTQTPMPGSPFHLASPEAKSGSVFAQFSTGGQTDDAFTSILSMSDADQRNDAWIPSDATCLILKSMAISQPGPPVPAVEQLSTPGIISVEPQGDPVKDLVLRYMGEQEAVKRSVLNVDSVTQDVDGLRKLIEAGCLRAAIDLTGRLLDQVGQGYGKAGQMTVHTPHSLQLWFCRLSLMVKLRMYEQAEAEMRAFQTLDTPDLYFQYYSSTYPGRRGSMVSFSMRLLHAELPLLCGRSQETLDRLYYILAVCNRDYEGALAIYNSLLEKDKKAAVELKAGIGRIHLQMGNIAEATRIMKEVETDTSKTDGSVSCLNLVSKGLVAMCANNFHDAYQNFKSAIQIQPENTCAVNNMAVCSLYLGRLKDALNTLEQLVHSDPANTLHEGVLFNLCTLYELETSRALHKKQAILDLVSKHKGDGFPVACLKMT